MRPLSVLFLLTIAISLNAQNWETDRNFLSVEKSDTVEQAKTSKKKFNPGHLFYNLAIGFYQKNLSPQIGAGCIYETTCSRFSRELVSEFGVVKGFFLSVDRVGRCNRLAAMEASPLRINRKGKIVEHVSDFKLRK